MDTTGYSQMKDLHRSARWSDVMYPLESSDLKCRSYLPDLKNSETTTCMPMTSLPDCFLWQLQSFFVLQDVGADLPSPPTLAAWFLYFSLMAFFRLC